MLGIRNNVSQDETRSSDAGEKLIGIALSRYALASGHVAWNSPASTIPPFLELLISMSSVVKRHYVFFNFYFFRLPRLEAVRGLMSSYRHLFKFCPRGRMLGAVDVEWNVSHLSVSIYN